MPKYGVGREYGAFRGRDVLRETGRAANFGCSQGAVAADAVAQGAGAVPGVAVHPQTLEFQR